MVLKIIIEMLKSIKLINNSFLCLASSVSIEMIIEEHNTLEKVKRRCEKREATNCMHPSLRPRDKHQFINLSTSRKANDLVENSDKCSDIKEAEQLETLHKVEGKSLAVHSDDKIVAWDRVETPGFEDCIRVISLHNFEVSSGGAENRIRQGIEEGCHPEKPGNTFQLLFIKLKLSPL